MKNIKEFKELIEKYESITLEDIVLAEATVDVFEYGFDIAQYLTGYGSKNSCMLCGAINSDCSQCVWGKVEFNFGCIVHPTFKAIENAEDAKELLQAFKNRAAYMREWLIQKEIE